MDAGPTVLPARGVFGGQALPPQPPLVRGLAVTPSVVSPNGDGYADLGTVAYTLATRAAVTALVTDATGATVETLFSGQEQSARRITFSFSADPLPDGRYTLALAVRSDDGRTASASAAFTVDRTLGFVTASPATISPNGDGVDDALMVSLALAAPGQATVTIVAPDGSTVATLLSGELGPGTYSSGWDGRLADGSTAPDGHYQVQVSVADALGTVTQAAAFDVASTPP
jgi:flagellar hook assembly protein FlgD